MTRIFREKLWKNAIPQGDDVCIPFSKLVQLVPPSDRFLDRIASLNVGEVLAHNWESPNGIIFAALYTRIQ